MRLQKIILSLLITQSFVMADNCSYYMERVKYFSDREDVMIQRQDWCGAADALEMMLNSAGSASNACSGMRNWKNVK
jgi:hypothetical protein